MQKWESLIRTQVKTRKLLSAEESKNRENRGCVRVKLRVFPHRVSFHDDYCRVLRQISIKLMGAR